MMLPPLPSSRKAGMLMSLCREETERTQYSRSRRTTDHLLGERMKYTFGETFMQSLIGASLHA